MSETAIILFTIAAASTIIFFVLKQLFAQKQNNPIDEEEEYLLNFKTGEIHYLPKAGHCIEYLEAHNSRPINEAVVKRLLKSALEKENKTFNGCAHCFPSADTDRKRTIN